jgi:hypothetical protein
MEHRKTFRIEQMFDPTKEIREYHDQVLGALARYKSDPPVFPLLVVRGNGGLIYCASYRDTLYRYWDSLPGTPGFAYRHGRAIWKMVLLDNLLSALRANARVRFVDGRASNAMCPASPVPRSNEFQKLIHARDRISIRMIVDGGSQLLDDAIPRLGASRRRRP